MSTAVKAAGLNGEISTIKAGWSYTCVMLDEGKLNCWGDNYFGQLGDGTDFPNNLVNVLGLTEDVVAIGAGEYIGCALISDGGVKCWGDTSFPMTGEGRISWK